MTHPRPRSDSGSHIRLRRAYEPAEPDDGYRILVDRVWPRGISKDELHIDEWCRDVAPSTELRKWFGHDPERWAEFDARYRAELAAHGDEVSTMADHVRSGAVTLVYGARDTDHNNAVVLRAVLSERLDDLAGRS